MNDHHGNNRDLLNDHHHHAMMEPVDHHHMVPDEMAGAHNPHNQAMESWTHSDMDRNESLKRAIGELQRHYISDFQRQREKLLIEVTEKLHEEFLADEDRTRNELVTQFKEELENTKEELDKKYRDCLKYELAQMDERHKKELQKVKRQQWCFQCEKEAIYPCCWNTAYCGLECQQSHWAQHKKLCKRKKTSLGNGK